MRFSSVDWTIRLTLESKKVSLQSLREKRVTSSLDTGKVDEVGVEVAGLDDLFGFDNSNLG
jgi:hypothetical protein